MTKQQKAIAEVLTVIVMIGLLLPSLISAKSTVLVVLGIAIAVSAVMFFCQVLPIKSELIKLLKNIG